MPSSASDTPPGHGHDLQDIPPKPKAPQKKTASKTPPRRDKSNTARERQMTTSSAPVDGAADALQVLRNRTFDEIAMATAPASNAFSPQDIQMFALQSGDVDPESSVSSPSRDTTGPPFVQTS